MNRFLTLCLFVIAGSACFTRADDSTQTRTFSSTTGFSDVQGANGWSYAGIYWKDVHDLRANLVPAIFNQSTNRWEVGLKGSHIAFTATQQNYTPGDSVFSLRYWTADRNYAEADVKVDAVATAMVSLSLDYVSSTGQKSIGQPVSDLVARAPGDKSEQKYQFTAAVKDIKAGDQIYLIMSNTAQGGDSSEMQTISIEITAIP